MSLGIFGISIWKEHFRMLYVLHNIVPNDPSITFLAHHNDCLFVHIQSCPQGFECFHSKNKVPAPQSSSWDREGNTWRQLSCLGLRQRTSPRAVGGQVSSHQLPQGTQETAGGVEPWVTSGRLGRSYRIEHKDSLFLSSPPPTLCLSNHFLIES